MKISPARTAAFDVLLRIERDRAFSSILLPQYESDLEINDRALCHQLVLGVLRSQIYLDDVLSGLTGKKRKLDPEVSISLRLGLFQLLFLDRIPTYSAVNESVNLVQRAKKSSAKGLVNAVLRQAAQEAFEPSFLNEIERVSIQTSHPRWLIEKWIAEFGFETTEELAKANNESPRLVFRGTLRTGDLDLGSLGRPLESPVDAFEAGALSVPLRNAAEEHRIYFQDSGSQIVARSVQLKCDERFLDVCAAPGSKSTYIAGLAEGKALRVAGDISGARVSQLRENCRVQGAGSVNVCQYDANQTLPFSDESFDAVLVDAPCSGTGTIRHNPEIRYFLEPNDFAELSFKQLTILKNASKVVKRGGRLIYSTCSLEHEENETVVDRFITDNKDFSPVRPFIEDRYITNRGFARTFPQRDGFDGFFIAEFRRS